MKLKTVYRTSFFAVAFILCSVCMPALASLPPTAGISTDLTSGLAPLAVSFDASGSAADTGRTITGYNWQFGDGSSSSGLSTGHTYSGYGIFTAVLTVTDDAGVSDTETVTINVRNGEIFTAADINNDGSIDLADFAVLASQWLKAPSQASADISPAAGDGIVGLEDLSVMTLNWLSNNYPPAAVLGCSNPYVEAGETVTFNSLGSSDPQGSVLRYLWEFGDGTPAVYTAGTEVIHVFADAGNYVVKLTVFDGDLAASDQLAVAIDPVTPDLQVSPAALDFGQLICNISWGQRAFSSEKFVEVVNAGSETVTVTGIYSTNPSVFKIISGATAPPLAAGDRHYIAVKFEPRVKSTDPNQPLGPRTGSLMIATAAGTQTIPLSGTIVAKETLAGVSSAVLMGYSASAPTSQVVASIKDFGTTELANTSSALVSVGNQGGVNMTFPSVEITGPDSMHFGWYKEPLSSGELYMKPYSAGDLKNYSYWGPDTTGFYPWNPRVFVKLIFAPQITAPTTKQFNAKAIIHTSGGDLEVAMVGKALYRPKLVVTKPAGANFEFNRTAPGTSTSILGTDLGEWYAYDPVVTISNLGLQYTNVSMSIVDISAGGASKFSFTPFGTMTLGPWNPSVTITGTFSPSVKGHHSAALVITPSDPNFPVNYTLLHGVGTATDVYPLGTTETWYTVDEWWFNNNFYDFAKFIDINKSGAAGYSGDLYEVDDPFMGGSFNVYVESWADFPNSAVFYNTSSTAYKGYCIDSSVFGPYIPGDPNNSAATNTRLAAGETIGSGGLLESTAFLSDTDGNKDILHQGTKPLLMDIAPDGTIFYTESLLESGVVRTRLKWIKATAKGTVEENLSTRLTGQAGSEPVILRAIAGSSYRIFVSFGTSIYDMDLSSSRAITATKSLTGLLTAIPGVTSRIDAAGSWVTAASDVSGHIQVFKENLHNGGKALFAQATVPVPDTAKDCLVDKLGNVFVQTSCGIYQFSPAGAAMNYILAGNTFYTSNMIGQNIDGEKNPEWYFDDFNLLWFSR